MSYAPTGKVSPVCGKGEFAFAALGLDHGHIYGMCNGLREAGAELALVYDPDPEKVGAFSQAYPEVRIARSEQELLDDPKVRLIASAAIPCERGPLGARVMDHGKDFFSDKPPFTSLEQLAAARLKVAQTGKKHAVYYAERLHVEAAVHAGRLLAEGAIGRVLSVVGFGPHRLNAPARPAWFWDKRQNGGILCDLGCHQVEQFLAWSGAKSAELLHSKVANYRGEHPGFEDYGDATFVADNGATHFMRLDWYTPTGLGAWGDGRTFITGSEGTLELRKYLDVGRDPEGDQLYLVDQRSEQHIAARGKAGFPFFGQLILDCLNRTEHAMTQAHAFLAIELALIAQLKALRVA
jgi:predicted dehydrogenase